MLSRVLILVSPTNRKQAELAELGDVISELSDLFRVTREREIDLVLFDEQRQDVKFPVVMRVRRQNGLTEFWKLVHGSVQEPDEAYVDGYLDSEPGTEFLRERVRQILDAKKLLAECGMVSRSPKMKLVAETIDRIAPTDVPVLIVGPSGSGKELAARALHDRSRRARAPFVAINTGAIAEGILESELFGHERGAFTGSVGKREGLFHKAAGGSLFLDEIGETKPDMQVKLLRVLEDGTYYPVGSSVSQKADVRVISATNRDLTEAIMERRFREDLYFRLGVVKIVLPQLYERVGDIQPLLQFFWRNAPKMSYTDGALNLLERYDWPGNVRQLKNFADRMAALKPSGQVEATDVERFVDEQQVMRASTLPVATGRTSEEAGQELIYRAILSLGNEIRMLRDLITSNLPNEYAGRSGDYDSTEALHGLTVEEMERLMIRRALRDVNGNRKEAARLLGIGERTLYRKLKTYDLS